MTTQERLDLVEGALAEILLEKAPWLRPENAMHGGGTALWKLQRYAPSLLAITQARLANETESRVA